MKANDYWTEYLQSVAWSFSYGVISILATYFMIAFGVHGWSFLTYVSACMIPTSLYGARVFWKRGNAAYRNWARLTITKPEEK
jgi:hypothetical protein